MDQKFFVFLSMPRTSALAPLALAMAASMTCLADEPAKAPRSRITLMLETEVVEGRKLTGKPEEYVSDGNPNTIELVALPKGDPGPSRVSADGQVIFLTRADMRGEPNDALLQKAFDILEKMEAEGAKSPPETGK